ncbi:lachesin-like [Anticarsia gemmatalis]|uniref:lachesin-like n=1 Tax=Anticarsia gemmatalis TaxID=129554 RepID=UPI003F760CCD
MSVESQRCLCVVVLLIHTVTGAGEGPTSPLPSPSSEKPEHNELTVTFPPLEDLYSNTPEKHFGTENNTVVTSQTGSTALLPCVIRNIGDGIVSWIRRKDYHLLTVGLTTYSSDQRFQAIHLQHSEDWTLKVRFVQKRDAGIYECQVSSHPPTSIFLRLDVVEARAQISGPTEKYLKPGSTLRLQCSVVQTTEAPAFVFWYHNSRMINYDVERGINVTTDPVQRLSDLLIPAASVSHAGNYTCVPNNAVPASIYVHIFNGENPAAMQSSSPSFITRLHGFLLPTLITLCLIR